MCLVIGTAIDLWTYSSQRDTLSDPDQTGDTFLEADLSDFCVYRAFRSRRAAKSATLSEKTASYQFASLNELNDFDVECFFFDGTLSFEGKHHYLEKIPFQLLSLGGYEDLTRVSVGSDIWIQSFQGQKADVWYRLGRPGKLGNSTSPALTLSQACLATHF